MNLQVSPRAYFFCTSTKEQARRIAFRSPGSEKFNASSFFLNCGTAAGFFEMYWLVDASRRFGHIFFPLHTFPISAQQVNDLRHDFTPSVRDNPYNEKFIGN